MTSLNYPKRGVMPLVFHQRAGCRRVCSINTTKKVRWAGRLGGQAFGRRSHVTIQSFLHSFPAGVIGQNLVYIRGRSYVQISAITQKDLHRVGFGFIEGNNVFRGRHRLDIDPTHDKICEEHQSDAGISFESMVNRHRMSEKRKIRYKEMAQFHGRPLRASMEETQRPPVSEYRFYFTFILTRFTAV